MPTFSKGWPEFAAEANAAHSKKSAKRRTESLKRDTPSEALSKISGIGKVDSRQARKILRALGMSGQERYLNKSTIGLLKNGYVFSLKEIARFIGKSVRQLQRYKKQYPKCFEVIENPFGRFFYARRYELERLLLMLPAIRSARIYLELESDARNTEEALRIFSAGIGPMKLHVRNDSFHIYYTNRISRPLRTKDSDEAEALYLRDCKRILEGKFPACIRRAIG